MQVGMNLVRARHCRQAQTPTHHSKQMQFFPQANAARLHAPQRPSQAPHPSQRSMTALTLRRASSALPAHACRQNRQLHRPTLTVEKRGANLGNRHSGARLHHRPCRRASGKRSLSLPGGHQSATRRAWARPGEVVLGFGSYPSLMDSVGIEIARTPPVLRQLSYAGRGMAFCVQGRLETVASLCTVWVLEEAVKLPALK